MDFAGLNYFAVAVATIASFLFGAIWYGVLAKPWVAAVGKSEEEIKASAQSFPTLLAITMVAQLIMAWVLAGLIGHWQGSDHTNERNYFRCVRLAWLRCNNACRQSRLPGRTLESNVDRWWALADCIAHPRRRYRIDGCELELGVLGFIALTANSRCARGCATARR